MMDREKVINDFIESIGIISRVDEPTFWLDFVRISMENALKLLKTQEPVEPYVTGHGTGFESATSWWYACGNCHEPIDPNDKFCRHCGRAVKWE